MFKVSLAVAMLCIFAPSFGQSISGLMPQQQFVLGEGDKSLDKVVTLMGKITIAQALDFLRIEDVNFVVAPDAAFLEGTANFNIKEKPLRNVMEAIALVFEGNWVRTGEVYVFLGPSVFVSNGVGFTGRGRIVQPKSKGGSSGEAPMPAGGAPSSSIGPSPGVRSIAPLEGTLYVSRDFWKSLSKFQRSQIASVGYLKLGQLNVSQRKMIGNPEPTGKTNLVLSEGHSIKIKLIQ